nr:MAG: hypothetical protein [Microvirus sp.]
MMKKRKTRIQRQASLTRSPNPYAIADVLTLLPKRVRIQFKTKTGRLSYDRTKSLRGSQLRSNTLYSPHSTSVRRKRRPKTMVPLGGTLRRTPLLGEKGRTPGHRNPCSKRAARKAVLFTNKLIGRAGSSPGKHHKYKRTVDSQYSCK